MIFSRPLFHLTNRFSLIKKRHTKASSSLADVGGGIKNNEKKFAVKVYSQANG